MSDNTFTLRIELGNDVMQTREDVAYVLHTVAEQLKCFRHFLPEDSGNIRDDNGNTVGRWTFTTELTTDESQAEQLHADNATDESGWIYEDADQRYGGNDNPFMED